MKTVTVSVASGPSQPLLHHLDRFGQPFDRNRSSLWRCPPHWLDQRFALGPATIQSTVPMRHAGSVRNTSANSAAIGTIPALKILIAASSRYPVPRTVWIASISPAAFKRVRSRLM